MEHQNIHNFSDFAQHKTLEGDKISIADVLNQPIVVFDYQVKNSKVHNCDNYLTVQFSFEGSEDVNVLFTASEVLIDQLKSYEGYLPFRTTVKKVKKYYTFT